MSRGIDYGMGMQHVDFSNGVRHGAITANHVCSEVLSDAWMEATDPAFDKAVAEAVSRVAQWEVGGDVGKLESYADISSRAAEAIVDLLDRDGFDEDRVTDILTEDIGMFWDDSNHTKTYEDEEYDLAFDEDTIYVFKSPWVTRCRFGSPCWPGGGDLDSPDEDGAWAYALGEDWFDKEYSPCPYTPVRLDSLSEEELYS